MSFKAGDIPDGTDHIAEAIKTLRKASRDPDKAYNGPATWYVASNVGEFEGGVSYQQGINYPCHMPFQVHTNKWEMPIILASGCTYADIYKEQSLAFIAWLLSPTESPWRSLLQEGFHTVDDGSGNLKGFYFDQEQLLKFPFLLFKNFCIAARIPYEYPAHVKVWYQAVQEGVSGSDALILASMLSWKTKLVVDSSRAGGHHWPIRPVGNGDGGYFDYNRWTNADPRPHYQNPNGCWTVPGGSMLEINVGSLIPLLCANSSNPEAASWQSSDIEWDVALSTFRKWKEKYVKA